MCRETLDAEGGTRLRCPADDIAFTQIDGIWDFLPPGRARVFERFVAEYGAVRRSEGRGSDDPTYFRALPSVDPADPFADQWRVRARSYRTFVRRVVRPRETTADGPLRVLDLGAGNGWLSYRLARRGHDLTAVDLQTDARDGLGAHVHYDAAFTPVRAEFDRLPFPNAAFDLVVFNASLHYAEDVALSLREALRVLRPDGEVVVLDSPVYRDPASGAQMVREREAAFEQRFGFRSDALASEHYLTHRRLADLEVDLGLRWRRHRPVYGLRRMLAPWTARLRGRREPGRFVVLAGRRADAPAPPRGVRPALWRAALRAKYRFLHRHRHGRAAVEHVAGRPLMVLPDVFNPKLFRTGAFLARHLETEALAPDAAVLDMGAGTGIGAVFAADRAGRIDAVDVNPEAVQCVRINALLHGVSDRVTVFEGDLFAPLAGRRYDLVLFNPPYFRGAPQAGFDQAWRSEDTVERFAAGLGAHLRSGGRALVVLSSDGDRGGFLAAFRSHGFRIGVAVERDLGNEVLTIYRLTRREGVYPEADPSGPSGHTAHRGVSRRRPDGFNPAQGEPPGPGRYATGEDAG